MTADTGNSLKGKPFLYLGDDSVRGAASYLAGVMACYKLDYRHVPSDEMLKPDILEPDWACIVISDFPSRNIPRTVMDGFVKKTAAGMGFLMIGGWDSFQGTGGQYYRTPLGGILPVTISERDDRINSSDPCLINIVKEHPIINNLPFDAQTPGIGGFNAFEARPGAEVLLESRQYRASFTAGAGHRLMSCYAVNPLLVTGYYGRGRVCAWASDAAPHWVGGLVDWGSNRVVTRGTGDAAEVEVGDLYAEFFSNMLLWTAGSLGT